MLLWSVVVFLSSTFAAGMTKNFNWHLVKHKLKTVLPEIKEVPSFENYHEKYQVLKTFDLKKMPLN